MLGKLIFLSTVVCVIALLLNIDVTSLFIQHTLLQKVTELLPILKELMPISENGESKIGRLKVFTKSELQNFKGKDNGPVYLALLGHVFDVTHGKKHYGPGGGYEFFTGIDASKAFITGKFDKEGLTDDISSLTPSEILGLEGWKSFYEKDYKLIGIVEGAFFNHDGEELEMMRFYKEKLDIGQKEKSLLEWDKQMFPPCNSEWSSAAGGRVWCTKRSGGVQRAWTGLPRMYYTAGGSKPRCACIRTTGPPSHSPQAKDHANRGDLDNPNLKIYKNCDSSSDSCPLPDS